MCEMLWYYIISFKNTGKFWRRFKHLNISKENFWNTQHFKNVKNVKSTAHLEAQFASVKKCIVYDEINQYQIESPFVLSLKLETTPWIGSSQ